MKKLKNDTKNPVVDLSFAFALNIVEYCEELEGMKKFVIAKQLFRSGTSVGANIRESQQAESKLDFIHKLKIALKEVEETDYWLLICQFSKNYPNTQDLSKKLNSIRHLLIAIIVNTRKNMIKPNDQNHA